MSENGCRPDVACLCYDDGVHVGISVTGEHRDLLIEEFRQRHFGPGHLPEVPPRSWYRREAAFARHLARVRADLARLSRTEDIEVVDTRPTDNVDSGGKL
jgi:hypothetical protein